METFTTYKISSEPQTDLFIPPPYCGKVESKIKEKDKMYYEEVPVPKLEVSHPGKLLELTENLTDGNTKLLEVKINRYLKTESGSHTVFLINLKSVAEQAVVQVVYDRILENIVSKPLIEESIAHIVEYKDNYLKCLDNLDPNIQCLLEEILPENSGEVLIFPVLSKDHKSHNCPAKSLTVFPVFLVCFVNPSEDDAYLSRLVHETFRYCLTLMLNTRGREEENRMKKQCQSLLTVARKLFARLADLNDLLREIMSEARRLTNAERCSLFLLDPDHMHLVAKVFDGISSDEKTTEVRIAKDQGIAGHVAATGKLLNIKNAYKHPLFYKGMDEATGFKTRNILCFPIRDNDDRIVGVAQLCNKIDGNFDYFDEQVANAFSIYCGISLIQSLVYKRIQDAQARTKISNELMMYHMQVNYQDVADVVLCPSPHEHPCFAKFNFTPRVIILKETPCFVLKIFEDLDFMKHFRIKKEVLVRFILYVRKGYRDLPYHNWSHAFSAAHFAFLCLKNLQLVEQGYITRLEALAYVISCLCHDIDHRGTTNSFQQQSNSVLASLYSSEGSVMERHHVSQTLCTLNTEGCNFLESLNKNEYVRCLDLIKDMILATDLATHYKIHSKQLVMVNDGYDRQNKIHRFYLVSLLMTCADLSDQTKDWAETKKVAELIYAEFFAQGDLEKKLGKIPVNMMDREKASIPDHQLEFLKEVCLCIFKLLAALFPSAKVLTEAIKKNIRCWESSKVTFDKLCAEGRTPFDVLTSEELEMDIQAKTLK